MDIEGNPSENEFENGGIINGDLNINGNIDAVNAEFENLEVKNSLTVNEFTFPLSDGTPNQVLATDGNGVVSWINDAIGIPPNLQDSYNLSSKPQITTSNAVGRETFQIKQGVGVTDPVLQVQDSTGTAVATIENTGEIKSQKNVIGTDNLYEIKPDDPTKLLS